MKTILFKTKKLADEYISENHPDARLKDSYITEESDYDTDMVNLQWGGETPAYDVIDDNDGLVARIAWWEEGIDEYELYINNVCKGDRRTIEVNHRLNEYKRKARELLTSEEGLKHRGRRCIEPEAVFGQIKFNMAYRRFRHFGKDKVTMDFAFFAIAFNLKKMCSKIAKQAKYGGNTPHSGLYLIIFRFLSPENRIFSKNPQKSVA